MGEEVLSRILDEYDDAAISADEQLIGFRNLHAGMPAGSTKEVSSPESLIRYCVDEKRMPAINLLVDIANLVSLETRLALGAHDIRTIDGDVYLRLTNGTEHYQPLGSDTNRRVRVGEYAYIDNTDTIICRLESRQVEKTKVELDATDCFYIVQGSRVTAMSDLEKTAKRLIELTSQLCGGTSRVLRIVSGL